MTDKIVISKSMVAFVFYDLSENELQDLYAGLIKDGYLLAVKGDRLVFPVSFLDSRC